jgi:zinc protease
MKIKHYSLGLLALLFSTSWASAQTVPTDNSFRQGKLSNGLTYYLRHNAKEKGIADFYIAQRVGSILEEPRQRGLAHFLEHMAFNGTEHFRGEGGSPGIVPWCETIGVKFGANLNAYTSVDQTVYHLSSVPVTRQGIIDSTLLLLHDWSHALLLTDREIDKERGVIHEEWRTRRAGMATQRMIENVLPIVYRGTKYADCLPIGSMDIVDHFPYNDLRDYYKKWYRPDLQAIIVVGDIDVDQTEQRLRQTFGTIPAPKNAAERVYYPVADNDTLIVATDKDSEQPIMLATLYMKRDVTPDAEKNRVAYLREDYVGRLVTSMLNGRLQELQHQATPPCLSATAHDGEFIVSRTKEAFSIAFGCRQENIRGSFMAAIGEAERARQFGFTKAELERAKAIQTKSANRHYAERNDRRNNYFVRKALGHFLESEPLTSDQTDYDLSNQFGKSVTLAEVNQTAREMISDKNQVLVVYAPDKEGFTLPGNDMLKQYVAEAQAQKLEPYKEETAPTVLMSQKPAAGRIVSEQQQARHGVTKLQLSNGVTVWVKPTDFSKDQISMKFWGEGGESLFPDADAISLKLMGNAIGSAGLGHMDAPTLRKVLASKMVKVSPFVGDAEQGISGGSSVKDMETMFQLIHLYVTALRPDTLAFRGEIDRNRSFLTNREANPQVAYNDSLARIVYGDSPRVRPLKRDMLDKADYGRILQMYREMFSSVSGFNMLLIGNIDLNVLRPLLCEYIASLPASRGNVARKEGPYRHPDVRPGTETHLFTKEMKTPSALVNVVYTFDEAYTPKADMALDLFKRALSIAYTDSVREEQGGTYGVSVETDIDPDSRPHALVKISFRTDPARYEQLMPIVDRQIEWIAKHGPEQSSIDKAKTYLRKAYAQNSINNQYWGYVLENEISHNVDFHTDYLKVLDSTTSADVQRVAQDLLRSKRRLEVTMKSK